jgi:peptidoglycan/xylan/chitin deacetylase (PgdA/CDA1 family)
MKRAVRTGRELVKSGLAATVVGAGLMRLWGFARERLRGPRIHVIGYHRVVTELDRSGERSPINPALCITLDSFRKQMRQVREQFEVLSLSDTVRAMAGEIQLDRDAVSVTFDDGYHDVYLRAAELLADLRIPASVFVPTGFAGAGRYLDHDRLYAAFWRARKDGRDLMGLDLPPSLLVWAQRAERIANEQGPSYAVEHLIGHLPAADLRRVADSVEARLGGPLVLDPGAKVLTPKEILALSDGGWEIGAHTVGHVVLTHEPLSMIRRQLQQPREDIQRWTGRPCRFLAWCNGLYSQALVDEARRAGYEGAVTTLDRWNDPGGDPFRISRKCLWEGHVRLPTGGFSSALSAAQLHDLFGDLGLTTPVNGEVVNHRPEELEEQACAS